MKRASVVIAAVSLLIAVFATATYLYNTQKQQQAEANAERHYSVLERAHSPTLGEKNSRVTIVEFFDPACETCRAFSPILKEMVNNYPDKIRLVLRYLPLHQGSEEVVKYLDAANQQGKFWELLDRAYETQQGWTQHHVVQLDEFARMLTYTSMDIVKANEAVKSPELAQRIQQDIADAKTLNVTKTPGFFVNGRPLTKFGYQEFVDLVKSEFEKFYTLPEKGN